MLFYTYRIYSRYFYPIKYLPNTSTVLPNNRHGRAYPYSFSTSYYNCCVTAAESTARSSRAPSTASAPTPVCMRFARRWWTSAAVWRTRARGRRWARRSTRRWSARRQPTTSRRRCSLSSPAPTYASCIAPHYSARLYRCRSMLKFVYRLGHWASLDTDYSAVSFDGDSPVDSTIVYSQNYLLVRVL